MNFINPTETAIHYDKINKPNYLSEIAKAARNVPPINEKPRKNEIAY